MTIPVFDSSTHPTLSGKWPGNTLDASFNALASHMDTEIGYIGACAHGLADFENYNHTDFMLACNNNPRLFPVAGYNPVKTRNIEADISNIAGLGYKGIKIHPRLYGLDLFNHSALLIDTFRCAHKNKLTVFLCTYLANTPQDFPAEDPYWQLVKIIKASPETRLILMHGGVTRVLQYAELVRFNDNILLDLSYTLVKYQGSSVSLDLKYLFQTFDRKICVGTDHPEFTLSQLRKALLLITDGIAEDKMKNICYKNLQLFLKINTNKI